MSEEERKEKQHLKTSKWANISLYLGILIWLLFLMFLIVQNLIRGSWYDMRETKRHIISIIFRSWLLVTFFLSIAAITCGSIGLICIKYKRNILKVTTKAVVGIICGLSCLFTIYPRVFVGDIKNIQKSITQYRCILNLSKIQQAMIIYAADFDNKYPPKDKWCDLLIEHARISKEDFICPGSKAKTGQSSYAINENAITLEPLIVRGVKEPNAPPDIVLLFESEPGWNQYGGPELLTIKNHNGRGCYIVFTDGHIEFVRKQNLHELKWKPDEAQQE
jgi:prepilin-type processing-associated H-X9-DG protein